MQRDYWYSGQRKLTQLEAPAAVGRKAAERALRRLNARQVSTGEVPVIFDPETASGLLRHLAGAVSGSSLYKGTSFLIGKGMTFMVTNLFTDEQFQEMRREVLRLATVRRELGRSMYMTGLVILASIVGMPLTAFFFEPKDPVAVSLLTVTIVAAMFCIRGYLKLMVNVFTT